MHVKSQSSDTRICRAPNYRRKRLPQSQHGNVTVTTGVQAQGSSDVFEALLVLRRQLGLQEHRIDPKLTVQQGIVAVDLREELHAVVSLREVRLVLPQVLRTIGTSDKDIGSRYVCMSKGALEDGRLF